MKKLTFLIIFFASGAVNAQNYASEQIKEFYDELEDYYLNNNPYNPIEPLGTCASRAASFSGRIEATAFYLLSLLRMYEATNDKAYLIKFINLTIRIQELRNDVCNIPGFPTHKGWVTNLTPLGLMYQDGHAVMPMSKFVYMVLNDPSLSNESLPDIGYIKNNDFGISFTSYYHFADWHMN